MAYTPDVTAAALAEFEDRRLATGTSWARLAEHLDKPLVWTTAALLGSHALSAEEAAKVGELLGLSDQTVAVLQRQPYRVADPAITSDPTIYRLTELVAVYGPALKELIHEEFGDGIMSAINCNIAFERQAHPDGDRVVITIDGKFLDYRW